MKNIVIACVGLLPLLVTAQQQKYPPTPDKIYGQLFKDVQLQQILPEGKIFVYSTPKNLSDWQNC
jgi:alpha,alpha-trehalase